MMSLREQLLRGIGGIAGLKFVDLAIGFITSIILARSLGPDGYGAYSFILAAISTLALVSYAGLPALIVRETARYELSENWGLIRGMLRRSHQFAGASAVLIMVLTVLISVVFITADADSHRWTLLLLASPLIPILALSHLRAAVLRGLRRVIPGSVPEMLVRPGILLLAVMAIIYTGNLTPGAALLAQIVATAAAFVTGVALLRTVRQNNRLKDVTPEYEDRAWLSALLPFTGIAGVSFINAEFVTLFLGFIGSNDDVAIFRVAVSLGLIVALPLSLVESVIPPYITRLYNSGDRGAIKRLTQVVSLGTLLISILPAAGFLIFGKELISLLYGSEYLPAYVPLLAIAGGYTLVSGVGLSMILLYATEYHSSAFKISALGAVLTVLLCLMLIPVFGPLGAAVVVGLGKALRAMLFVFAARRHLGIKASLIW